MKNEIRIWNEKEQRFVLAGIQKASAKKTFIQKIISLF